MRGLENISHLRFLDSNPDERFVRMWELYDDLVFPVTVYDAVHDTVHAGIHELV